MKKIYYLSTCDTCKRIMKELPLDDFIKVDIKTDPLTENDLGELCALSGSYEVLFSKVERVEFIPIQEFAFEVYEEPVVQMFEEIYIEEIAKEEINIGMATALPSGNLIVPVVKNADKKTLKELAASINSLSLKARKNKLKADDTSDSTFTISNVGTFGSVMGTPIINQPEAAILATGIIKKRAEVIERPAGDSIEIRQMMYLSLSFDHRIVDGFLAGSFLRRIADNLENFDSNRKI